MPNIGSVLSKLGERITPPNRKLMGIEVIEASKVMGKKIEIKLPELSAA